MAIAQELAGAEEDRIFETRGVERQAAAVSLQGLHAHAGQDVGRLLHFLRVGVQPDDAGDAGAGTVFPSRRTSTASSVSFIESSRQRG